MSEINDTMVVQNPEPSLFLNSFYTASLHFRGTIFPYTAIRGESLTYRTTRGFMFTQGEWKVAGEGGSSHILIRQNLATAVA